MTTVQKKILLAVTLAISVVSLAGLEQTQIFAEETAEKKYTQANDIAIHTAFSFNGQIEESDGFQVFNQKTGFAHGETPSFTLEGVVDAERVELYEITDQSYKKGGQFVNSSKTISVDIYLHDNGTTLRHFSYEKCFVADYEVVTLFDKEEGWNSSKGFAIIDKFTFECNGFTPENPLYDLVKTNGYHVDTVSTLDLMK